MPTPLFVILVVLLGCSSGSARLCCSSAGTGTAVEAGTSSGPSGGPLFVPIAIERGRRAVGVLARTPGPAETGPLLTVLVGVDGSPESDQAVREAGRLFGSGSARIHLVGVADPDLAEFGDTAGQQAWHELLARCASWLPPDGVPPVLELLCGQPDRVLLEVAESELVDVLVVGHGAGACPTGYWAASPTP